MSSKSTKKLRSCSFKPLLSVSRQKNHTSVHPFRLQKELHYNISSKSRWKTEITLVNRYGFCYNGNKQKRVLPVFFNSLSSVFAHFFNKASGFMFLSTFGCEKSVDYSAESRSFFFVSGGFHSVGSFPQSC